MKTTHKNPPATKSAKTKPSFMRDIRSILVPCDFSPGSERAIAAASSLAELCGAHLTLLHVVEPIATPDFVNAFPLALQDDALTEQCRAQLEVAAHRAAIDPALIEKVLVRSGRAFNEIVSAARTLKSDLIVIATHGRTGLKHVLLGSTTERVVQHAPCPVLVVRQRGRDFFNP